MCAANAHAQEISRGKAPYCQFDHKQMAASVARVSFFKLQPSTPAGHRVAGGGFDSVSIMLDVMSRQACGVISPLMTGARNHTPPKKHAVGGVLQ